MGKGKTQKKFNPEFKLNAVLESYINGNVSATADKHGVHVTQLNHWRKHLLTQGAEIFKRSMTGKSDEQRKIEQMERTIGKLVFQNDLLKKVEELLH